ncbi:hypothetical protein KSP40_PGU006084 [Platanthera guangdongensis]|uniref:Uncharacterized protein n=1 Tax=Platanthera guangdongensis TaxID=2320717 RepID=A0ABR2M7M6_9ASPA
MVTRIKLGGANGGCQILKSKLVEYLVIIDGNFEGILGRPHQLADVAFLPPILEGARERLFEAFSRRRFDVIHCRRSSMCHRGDLSSYLRGGLKVLLSSEQFLNLLWLMEIAQLSELYLAGELQAFCIVLKLSAKKSTWRKNRRWNNSVNTVELLSGNEYFRGSLPVLL